MKINEAEKMTGLSKKAIRLYESKGLIRIQRISNGYRDYTDSDMEILKQIKLLRLAGVSISDIKLWKDHIISIEKLLEKRKNEIEKEYGHHSKQYDFCETIVQCLGSGQTDCQYELEETEEESEDTYGELIVGIDIGTTTISASVIDLTEKKQIEFYTIENDFNIKSEQSYFAEQNAQGIANKALELLDHIINCYTNIRSVGVTGQMHGILYVDQNGDAVSPLVTWQDKRGDRVAEGNMTYCDQIQSLTGMRVATGYGFVTHYYNLCNQLVPERTYSFCSIMDYVVMKLTGRKTPLIHTSVAASFGMFDLEQQCFMRDKLQALSLGDMIIPDVTDDFSVCGMYRDIPVCVAIGDNQASFLGSVQDVENSVLVNIGTGSQISMMSDYRPVDETIELRPLVRNKYLLCGSALCGGSSYALLEGFFRNYALFCGCPNVSQYEFMNQLAMKAYIEGARIPTVHTTFRGTRSDPARKGCILELDDKNFTPANLTLGVIVGMCRELYEFYADAKSEDKNKVVLSGGAAQKNEVLNRVIADMFQMPVLLSDNKEEASTGVALFSAVGANLLNKIEDFADSIHYKTKKEG